MARFKIKPFPWMFFTLIFYFYTSALTNLLFKVLDVTTQLGKNLDLGMIWMKK